MAHPSEDKKGSEADNTATHTVRIALAGNPNCGKTTIFNALTGAHQHVGNYAGVTVERRDGSFQLDGNRTASLTDLPGTYSLMSLSPEERVAQDELLSSQHDVVIVVADSTNLQRNLVLMAQVMQMGANIVLCLNMADEAKASGQVLDLLQMEKLLGCPVVETVGHKRQGIEGLKKAIVKALDHPSHGHRLVMGERIDSALSEIRALIPQGFARAESLNWYASRLLIQDKETVAKLAESQGGNDLLSQVSTIRNRVENATGHDAALLITEAYFGFVDGLLHEVMTQRSRADARALTEKIDTVLANKFVGLIIFAFIMYGIFWLTFTLGDPIMRGLEVLFEWLTSWISSCWAPNEESLLKSLFVDGIIGGVGGVIVFLPNILLLFLGLAFLEDTGYLARAAFLVDQLMHRFGLHGKSFIPLMTGFGCTVPGIMATRTLENEKDRLITMFVLPLISCGARLPIWLLLIPAFFPTAQSALMMFGIYATGVLLALLLALTLRKTVLKGEESPFVMELPPYRMPTLRGILAKMWERGWMYLKKAGTIILAVSIVLWALTSFPKAGTYEVDALVSSGKITVVQALQEGNPAQLDGQQETSSAIAANDCDKTTVSSLEERLALAKDGQSVALSASELTAVHREEDLRASYASHIGHALEPIFQPLGFDWRIVTAMLGAFAAKEVFVAQMGIVFAVGEGGESSATLRDKLHQTYTPLTGLTLMLFLLISAPCMATIAVTKRESGSWKWALGQLFGLTLLAYVVALLVRIMGLLLGF